jgi:hypothetical protein
MFRGDVGVARFTMLNGVHDVSGVGRLCVQHGHTHERSKPNRVRAPRWNLLVILPPLHG